MSSTLDSRWLAALEHSRYLACLLNARPELVPVLTRTWEAPLTSAQMLEFLQTFALTGEDELKVALRRLRQRVMAHLILRDLCAGAPLSEIVETMTALADLTVNFAHDRLHAQLAGRYGEPLDGAGRPQRLIIVGMGKLGGRELNVSSDIDLIFVYPEEGQTAGPTRVDTYDFFNRLGKRLIAVLAEANGDGQVFRVDMRLRPNGDSGPLVCSLDSLENYFITQGREWERYAWIKARVLNPATAGESVALLEGISRPFIFRRYLDFGAINAMRDLHAQIRREVARKDMADHVKLGPGGIREIEFIAQVFQLIRGGRDTALQIKPTLQVLDRLVERKLLPPETRDELAAAYDYLRRVEHRLQFFDDAQTHMLPGTAEDQAKLALSMGVPDYATLMMQLDAHRVRVSHHFEQVFTDPGAKNGEGEENEAEKGLWLEQFEPEVASAHLTRLGYADAAGALALVRDFRSGGRYQQLPTSNRERLDALGPRLLVAAGRTPSPNVTLGRCLAFFEAICRRGAYLALLQQYPQALKRVAEMVGVSSWASDYLIRHPLVLDELLDPQLLDVASDWQGFRAELHTTLAEHDGDDERQMDLLRELHHATVFRLLAQDLAGLHTIERISDHLTELADIVLGEVLTLCWGKLRKRHLPAGEAPRFAVIGYGKLGGKELGYGSDLDIVFLYDDEDQSASEVYARLAQRMNTWLSSQTPAGILFETDLRLRPNGDSGLIVTPVEGFRDYQLKNAWVWEHQALTRARFCAGDARLGQRFETIRQEILRQPRDLQKLREEVLAMRQKMLDSHASRSADEFDLKQDPGGIIDVEFLVQFLVLGHAGAHPELCGNLGNIALLRMAAEIGLIPAPLAEPVRTAYREYRRLQHAKRLDNGPQSRVNRASVQPHIDAVRGLWNAVFAR